MLFNTEILLILLIFVLYGLYLRRGIIWHVYECQFANALKSVTVIYKY